MTLPRGRAESGKGLQNDDPTNRPSESAGRQAQNRAARKWVRGEKHTREVQGGLWVQDPGRHASARGCYRFWNHRT